MVKYLEFRSTDTLQKFLDENFLTFRDLNDLLKFDEIPAESLDNLIFESYPFLAASRKKLMEDISLKKELHKNNCIFYLSEETAEGVKIFLPQITEHKPVPFATYDLDSFKKLVENYCNEEQLNIVVIKIIKTTPLNNHKLNFIISEIFEAHPNTEKLISEIFFHDVEKEEEKKRVKKQVQEEMVTILQPILKGRPTSFEQFINQLNANGVLVAANDEMLLFSYNQQLISFDTFVFDENIGDEEFSYEKLQSLFVKNAEESNQSFFALLKSGQYKQTLLLQTTNPEFIQTIEDHEDQHVESDKNIEVEPSLSENNEPEVELNMQENARNDFDEEPDIDEDALATIQMLKATQDKEHTNTQTISNDIDEEPVIEDGENEIKEIADNYEYV